MYHVQQICIIAASIYISACQAGIPARHSTWRGSHDMEYEERKPLCASSITNIPFGDEEKFVAWIAGRQITYIKFTVGGEDWQYPYFTHISSIETHYGDHKPFVQGHQTKDDRPGRVVDLTLDVDQGEYISELSVHCSTPGNRKHVGPHYAAETRSIAYLEIRTSTGRSISAGDKTKDHYYIKVYGKRVSSFFGTSGPSGLENLGVAFAAVPYGAWPFTVPNRASLFPPPLTIGAKDQRKETGITKVPVKGNNDFINEAFNDTAITSTKGHLRISHIWAHCGERVDNIQFEFRNMRKLSEPPVTGPRHGGLGGHRQDLGLATNEFITTVITDTTWSGKDNFHANKYNTLRIGYLELWTSNNQFFTCGKKTRNTEAHGRPGRAVLAFYGRRGQELDALGFDVIDVLDY